MTFDVLDPKDFLSDGMFMEDAFLAKADSYDWAQFSGKKVLVRGCSVAIIPPWVFMYFTGKLAPYAQSVRYGNEHDNVVVFRVPRDKKQTEEN